MGYRNSKPHKSATRNYPSDVEQKQAITEYLLKHDSILGPHALKDVYEIVGSSNISVVPIFAVKQRNKIRPITDFSYGKKVGDSFNCHILEDYKHVEYPRFKEIVRMLDRAGKGALIWVIDAKDAYCRVPINKKFWRHAIVKWLAQYWILTYLPMGMASSCKLYTVFGDSLLWILQNENPELFYKIEEAVDHYIDDFWGVAQGATATAQFEAFDRLLKYLGIPTTAKKRKSPNTLQILLGFEYNTVLRTVRVPDDKYNEIISELVELINTPANVQVTKLQLLSIIGKLRWMCSIIRPGCAFVRRMELYANQIEHLHEGRCLNVAMKADMRWWIFASARANRGYSFDDILRPRKNFEVEVWTDASGTIGYGGFDSLGNYFQKRWSSRELSFLSFDIYIQFQELFAVLAHVCKFAHLWANKRIHFWCDNKNVVNNLRRYRTNLQNENVMCLLRQFATLQVKYNFKFCIDYISSTNNDLADRLSRFLPFDIPHPSPKQFNCNKIHAELMRLVEVNVAEHKYGIRIKK